MHLFRKSNILDHPPAWLAGVALCTWLGNAALALLLGTLVAIRMEAKARSQSSRWGRQLLQYAVIATGLGLPLERMLAIAKASAGLTGLTIAGILALGMALTHVLKVDGKLGLLLSGGTAICGGSAIAALSPSIRASQVQTAVAMAVVFLLNGVALVLFPVIGRALQMDQEAFGIWSALAIHDTSSVVGAAGAYGDQALGIATTMKLTRALWILPVCVLGSRLCNSQGKAATPFPWFLAGFVAASLIATLLPAVQFAWDCGALAGRSLMTGACFLIGTAVRPLELGRAGLPALACGTGLWILSAAILLACIRTGWIHL